MSRFEDLVNQQLSQAREAQALKDGADKQEALQKDLLYSQTVSEFQADPRLGVISGILNNPDLREAVSFLFAKLRSKFRNPRPDNGPVFEPPLLTREKFEASLKYLTSTDATTTRKAIINENMRGTISFDTNYILGDADSSNMPTSHEGFTDQFRTWITSDQTGTPRLTGTFDGDYGMINKSLFSANGVAEFLNILSEKFTKKSR